MFSNICEQLMNKSANKLARSINPGDQLRNDLRKRVHNKNDSNAELRKLKRLKKKHEHYRCSKHFSTEPKLTPVQI